MMSLSRPLALTPAPRRAMLRATPRGVPMDRWNRRQFVQGVAGLGLLAGCGRVPGQAPSPRPKPATVPRLGWLALASLTDDPGAAPLLAAFREGLRDQGWFEGQNLTMDYRSAEGRGERLPGLA